jgi:excisionase family DNA binding protein
MNLKTAALRLEVHYQTAYRWVRSGRLVAVKVGPGYEVSEAAVARLQAQRAATERTPERSQGSDRTTDAAPGDAAPGDAAPTNDGALHVLDQMVDAVTLESAAVGERAARVAAENLGDTAFVYRRSPAGETLVVYAAHRDPISEVAASTLGRDPRTPTNLVRRAIANGEIICVPQVPQQELRRRLHPELHENLHLSGCYSAACAPIGASGALLVTRDLPGRPYTSDDLGFIEALAARVARADERARCWTAAWEVRRAMVAAFRAPTFEGDCFDTLLENATGDDSVDGEPVVAEAVVAVLDLELRHVACSKAYAALVGADVTRLTGVSLRSIVRDGGALDVALAPVLRGEIDFRSVELEVIADRTRVALHLAMVRRDDATPRGVVLVAHPVPALSSG